MTAQAEIQLKQLPGDFAIWLFILAELSVFALFFILYAITRARFPEMFAQGQAQLSVQAGVGNTLALLTSSWFVVRAQQKVHAGQAGGNVFLMLALASACVYLWIKSVEYQHSVALGFDLSTNDFYFFYYGLTAFHMLHVILGMLILMLLMLQNWRGKYRSGRMNEFESGACYWHMVDLLWLVLFPLVYIL